MQKHLTTQLWTLRQAAGLADVGIERAGQWFACGMFVSIAGGGRDGIWHRVDFSGVVSVAVIAELRRRGLSREVIAPVSRYVCELGARRLLRRERSGRMLLIVSAGQRKPRLVDAESIGIAVAGGAEIAMTIDLGPIVAGIRGRISNDVATVNHARVSWPVN